MPVATTTKQAEVIRTLAEQWMRERPQEGERLPGERALARQLGVSRITVKAVVDKLARLGVVDRRGTSGTYLSKRPTGELIAMVSRGGEPVRGRGRRSAPTPRTKVISRNIYRLALMHCLKPGDQSAGDVIGGASNYCQQRGHLLSIGASRPVIGPQCDQFSDQVYRSDADGLILWVTLRERDLPNLAKISVPHVVLSDGMVTLDSNQVMLDTSLGCRQAIDVLARHGARRIAVLEVQYRDSFPKLRGACITAMDRMPGIAVDHYFSTDPIGDLLQANARTDAIYFNEDVCCAAGLPRLQEAGWQIGQPDAAEQSPFQTVSVISMAKMHHQNLLPLNIGRMAFDIYELGRQAAMTLERLLDERLAELPALRVGPRYVPPVTTQEPFLTLTG